MREVVWRYDPQAPSDPPAPQTGQAARQLLIDGNARFAEAFSDARVRQVVDLSSSDLGLPDASGKVTQRPFASVLACADARVPVELILGQRANSLFVVRVAGNTPLSAGLGSIDFALTDLETVRLQVVLGHTSCGAVTAAVEAYLDPLKYVALGARSALQSLVDRILAPVRTADLAMHHVHGPLVSERPNYRTALVETAVVANAAMVAQSLARTYRDTATDVVMAVYDLNGRQVGLPGVQAAWNPGLADPPTSGEELTTMLHEIAFGNHVRGLLDAA